MSIDYFNHIEHIFIIDDNASAMSISKLIERSAISFGIRA